MLEQVGPIPVPDASPGPVNQRTLDAVAELGELPDLLLVERSRSKDVRAFETLMRRYNRRLFRIARSILRDEGAAEEAVRAAHFKAYSDLDHYEPAGKFGTWVARLTFNEAVAIRRHGVTPTPDDIEAATAQVTAPVTADEATAVRRVLEEAIDGLPEVFRTVLVLRVLEGLSGVEVALCLGLNETTVRTRLYRAQQRLQLEVAKRLRAEPVSIFELAPERGERIIAQVLARVRGTTTP